MSKINKFEDIESWKIARQVTKDIYEASSSGNFSRDFALRDQIRRAVISIMSNIADGFERGEIRSSFNFSRWEKGLVVKQARSFM